MTACGRKHCEPRHSSAQTSRSGSGRAGGDWLRCRGMTRVRLDALLHERGLFPSRSRAAASVMAGEVRVGENGERASKPGMFVTPDVAVSIQERPRYVSRGGIKLANAIVATGIEVVGRSCLDVGAS